MENDNFQTTIFNLFSRVFEDRENVRISVKRSPFFQHFCQNAQFENVNRIVFFVENRAGYHLFVDFRSGNRLLPN